MSTTTRYPISALPLPPTTHILTHNLTPDENTPSVPAFKRVLAEKPSLQRRARLLAAPAHYSHVAPFPLPFPFEIAPPDPPAVVEDKAAYVEKWLADREARHLRGEPAPSGLGVFYPDNREQPRELIGLAETGWKDCLPHLDIGDALDSLGSPTLAKEFGEEDKPKASDEEIHARQQLVDVLSGHAVLMSTDNGPVEYAPWSLRYSGHQFGSWAGQLGDGRAISLLATPHPSQHETSYEVQLKGAGRTPFSRSADGLAVLRSSIREFLCAEAMHALRIPSTRSLTLVHLPALPVQRERTESACVLARVAPSFLRVGSFEALNGPQNMFFFGGGQQEPNYDGLRILGEWVGRRVLRLEDVQWDGEGEASVWGRKLVMEVARRNAKMVAGWQAYGWMHGVINTDNISIMGLTIDYGPYAFMDVFDPQHICNHSDDSGRYNYERQPSMIVYALRALLDALAPLIGAEAEKGTALKVGWATGVSEDQIKQWTEKGKELVQEEMEKTIMEICSAEYARLMHARLGLKRLEKDDEAELVRPLLTLMREHRLDFHGTFRKLCAFRPGLLASPAHADSEPAAPLEPNACATQSPLEQFLSGVLSQSPEPERLDVPRATKEWLAWLEKYATRIEMEAVEWEGEAREVAMRSANPRFVLRQWVLEEVIRRVERDPDSGKRVLAKVLKMACEPYEPWGAEAEEEAGKVDPLGKETEEERRFCGMGERKMLGFQCSCSS